MRDVPITRACANVEAMVVHSLGRQSIAVLAMVLGRLCHLYKVQPDVATHVMAIAYANSTIPASTDPT
jgi:hypothetical protein